MHLKSGSAQIMFHSGAVVDLTSPCEFELTGPNRGRLTAGSLEALVPDRATGFTVDLPGGESMIGLGARFKLHVDQDRSSLLRVIEGAVELRSPAGETRRLDQTKIARIDDHGRIILRAPPDD